MDLGSPEAIDVGMVALWIVASFIVSYMPIILQLVYMILLVLFDLFYSFSTVSIKMGVVLIHMIIIVKMCQSLFKTTLNVKKGIDYMIKAMFYSLFASFISSGPIGWLFGLMSYYLLPSITNWVTNRLYNYYRHLTSREEEQ